MRILIVAEYYPPEQVGAGIWIHELATGLHARGHAVSVLTAFPNYPQGRVFPGYRGRVFQQETMEGVRVLRSFIYATPRRTLLPRAASFGSFCVSALLAGWANDERFDALYAILPPLPLGMSAALIARAKALRGPAARLVVNVQDLYPDLAVASGYIQNRVAIRLFAWMEKWIYDQADRLVVISEGFRENLLAKGVAAQKIAVVGNWVDADRIRPGPRHNTFRSEVGGEGKFTVVYSGGLGHNAGLAPLLDAAAILRGEPFQFVIVGDGPQKPELVQTARQRGLSNICFQPFQPLERYPEVLAAADATLVTVNRETPFASVPSKIFKQMSAGRPILALAEPGNELDRMVRQAGCGYCVSPREPQRLAETLCRAAAHPEETEAMGQQARRYVEQNCTRELAVSRIEKVLEAAGATDESDERLGDFQSIGAAS